PNGGGKTTLLRLVLGLERPDAGRVRLFGSAPQSRGMPRVGFASRRAQLASATRVTVREVVEAGRLSVRGPLGPLRAEDRAGVARTIQRARRRHHPGAPRARRCGV